jgi:hypothetical protein
LVLTGFVSRRFTQIDPQIAQKSQSLFVVSVNLRFFSAQICENHFPPANLLNLKNMQPGIPEFDNFTGRNT